MGRRPQCAHMHVELVGYLVPAGMKSGYYDFFLSS
jgi:hypothetical protein